jgi:hypothetical protein
VDDGSWGARLALDRFYTGPIELPSDFAVDFWLSRCSSATGPDRLQHGTNVAPVEIIAVAVDPGLCR